MYYRVGAFYRNENSKAIIIQVHDRKEAESWVPRVKAMLYPGEDTANFRVSIFEFKLQINLNNLNHYRITVERPIKRDFKDWGEENLYDNSLAFDGIVEANDIEDAKVKFMEEWFNFYSLGKKPEELHAGKSIDLMFAVAEMRERKGEEEIAALEEAFEIGYQMHTTAMRYTRPGRTEHEVAAMVDAMALRYGTGVSFTTIFSNKLPRNG